MVRVLVSEHAKTGIVIDETPVLVALLKVTDFDCKLTLLNLLF